MCLCTRDQTTRTACAPATTAVVEHMLDPLAGHRRIRQGAASRHAETRRRLIYRGRDTGRRHRVCGQCRGYRVGSGSMVAGRCHKATPQPNTSGAMSTNMSCTWARGPRSSFTACQPAIGRYLGRESTTSQSRSASRPWRRRVNLVPRTLTTPTAPNKLLPSGLKLHQKNGCMEARRCHNSATVGAPPRLPTELFVRLRITPARGRGDKQEVLMGR